MSLLNEQYAFRDQMLRRLELDLIGPLDGDDELVDELPLDRYIVAVLWPLSDELKAEESKEDEAEDPDDAGSAGGDGAEDAPIAQALMRYPSSAGMTFSVNVRESPTVSLHVAAAQYLPAAEPAGEPKKPADTEQRSLSRRVKTDLHWKREVPVIEVVEQGLLSPEQRTHTVAPGLDLYVLVRPEVNGVVTVSAVVRNTKVSHKGDLRDSAAWFQIGLTARTASAAIIDRSIPRETDDLDLDSAALLYRSIPNFAIGHGCAVDWKTDSKHVHRTDQIKMAFIPRSTVMRARPGQLRPEIDVRMSFLATAEPDVLRSSLTGLVSEYRSWIDGRRDAIDSLDLTPHQQQTAVRHLDEAARAADRVQAGIGLLEEGSRTLQAFRLANRAMQLQRARQDWIRAGRPGDIPTGDDQKWYPFQIAFILLNLNSLVDPRHDDRGIADLLWFPTGGGKTEAYLGLIAFTVIRRRLEQGDATGVGVIMRYTLRLLTIQQFERAAMLMCSLDHLRREVPDLGAKQFRVGLWVGSKVTPNTLDDARRALNKMKLGGDPPEGNPVQLTRCPWCGVVIGPEDYGILNKPERHLQIACNNRSCEFVTGLPVQVIDEDIYRDRPDLLIGTVDKFAAMAWNEHVGNLFARDGQGLPPDLIIQDELHLISGPLGSMVGLYEAAIDAACNPVGASGERQLPKVIGSTATIRRAEQQIKSVFGRRSAVFPPPGLDPDQSFFAVPAGDQELGTREYAGIMAPSSSHASLMIRVYASLLQSAKSLPGSDDVRDPYWTLLGYFNSLRVLGSAHLQVQDDVGLRLAAVSGRAGEVGRKVKRLSELTSRVNSREIPERLKNLETRTPSNDADDVVLATNMISVGVDVDRLGLMAVMGQPQSSAEYIQATSRVGRKHPGLVVTIFNSARSRDRSHYESFKPFHEALYRAVEATSATPFAARARDRGLHGLLVSMARLLIPALSTNGAADAAPNQQAALDEIAQIIHQRVENCAPVESDATMDEIASLIDTWVSTAEAQPNMKYRDTNNLQAALLVDPAKALVRDDIEYSVDAAPWPTLMSMRDVDAESTLHQISLWKKS